MLHKYKAVMNVGGIAQSWFGQGIVSSEDVRETGVRRESFYYKENARSIRSKVPLVPQGQNN